MTSLVLQGRLDSIRLPGKSLLPLDGQPLLFRVMEALNRIPCDVRILACPEDCVSSFAPLAEKAEFELVSGPKEDVLARYCAALRRFPSEYCIRATGDNPFVFADAASVLLIEAVSRNADYAGFQRLPRGAGVEIVKADALFRAEAEARKKPEREHVCPYLYGHPELFCLYRPEAPPQWLDQKNAVRISVDTRADFTAAENLYAALSRDCVNGARYLGTNIMRVYKKLEAACA